MNPTEQINNEEEVVDVETQNDEGTEDYSKEMRSLAELLEEPKQAEKPQKEETKAESPEGEENATPRSLKGLAEKLGVEDKDLYDIEIPMANGESQTLGQIKDHFAKHQDFTVRELEFEETRAKSEQDDLRVRAELQQLLAELPANFRTGDAFQKAAKKANEAVTQQRQSLLKAIPEWSDQDVRTQEAQGLIEHLESYGFPKNYLQTMSDYDHKLVKYFRDSWKRQQRTENFLKQIKTKTQKSATSKPTGSGPRKVGANSKASMKGPGSDLAKYLAQ